MTYMETLSQAISRLEIKGYTSIITDEEITTLSPQDWVIDAIDRFEGKSNPADNSILYAISKRDKSRKSLLVSAYGADNDAIISDFMKLVTDAR